jgi:hypothetical protein
VGLADIDQWGPHMRMRLTRYRSRSGRQISRTFDYSGHLESGQVTFLFEDSAMRGFVTGAMVLKLSSNGNRLLGKTVYNDHDTGMVVAHNLALVRSIP